MSKSNITKSRAIIPKSNGTMILNDSNYFEVLLTQMRYLSNTLYHLSYLIQLTIISSDRDILTQNTETTYKNVATAFNYMHYYYDILSYLEWELQALRNNNEGTFFRKAIPDKYKQYDKLVFRYQDILNADILFTKKSRLMTVSSSKKVRDEFHELYEEMDNNYIDAKNQFISYLKLIQSYNLFYDLFEIKNVYGLFDKKRNLYPNPTIGNLYKHPMIYVQQFMEEFKTNKKDYKKTNYVIPRITSKETDESIRELTNTIVHVNTSSLSKGTVITYKSLELSSKDFIDYLTEAKSSFTISSSSFETVSRHSSLNLMNEIFVLGLRLD